MQPVNAAVNPSLVNIVHSQLLRLNEGAGDHHVELNDLEALGGQRL